VTQKSDRGSSFTESKNYLATSVDNSRRPQWDGSVAHSIPVVQERLSGRKPRRNRRKVAVHPLRSAAGRETPRTVAACGRSNRPDGTESHVEDYAAPQKFRTCGRRHFREKIATHDRRLPIRPSRPAIAFYYYALESGSFLNGRCLGRSEGAYCAR
jgi:hypothetical protein